MGTTRRGSALAGTPGGSRVFGQGISLPWRTWNGNDAEGPKVRRRGITGNSKEAQTAEDDGGAEEGRVGADEEVLGGAEEDGEIDRRLQPSLSAPRRSVREN